MTNLIESQQLREASAYVFSSTLPPNITTVASPPFELHQIIAPSILLWIFFVVGIALNLITIIVIFGTPKLKNPFVWMILSLCFSDLISALISPLFWYRRTFGFNYWALSDVMCKFYWATDLMTSYSTALHITAFAVMRFMSINRPHFYLQFVNMKKTKVLILVLWSISFFAGFIPFALFTGAKKRNRSLNVPESRWPSCTFNLVDTYKVYQLVAFPIFFCAPLITVTCFSVMTMYAVNYRNRARRRLSRAAGESGQNKKEKQAVVQLLLIVFSFMVAYVPFVGYEIWSTQNLPDGEIYKKIDYWLGFSEYILLRFSECLNPIFYNLGSRKMRKHTKEFLKLHFCKNHKNHQQDVHRHSVFAIAFRTNNTSPTKSATVIKNSAAIIENNNNTTKQH